MSVNYHRCSWHEYFSGLVKPDRIDPVSINAETDTLHQICMVPSPILIFKLFLFNCSALKLYVSGPALVWYIQTPAGWWILSLITPNITMTRLLGNRRTLAEPRGTFPAPGLQLCTSDHLSHLQKWRLPQISCDEEKGSTKKNWNLHLSHKPCGH